MLKQYGLTDNDIYLDRNSRSFISAEALILIVIAGNKLRDPGQSAEQFSWASLFVLCPNCGKFHFIKRNYCWKWSWICDYKQNTKCDAGNRNLLHTRQLH